MIDAKARRRRATGPRVFVAPARANAAATPAVNVFVVLDTMGAGRIVGVFSRLARAAAVRSVNPSYYRLIPTRVNDINPECVRWLLDRAGRDRLRRLSAKENVEE